MEQENKQNIDNFKMIPVHSTNLAAIGYDEENKKLKVIFRGKNTYNSYIYSNIEKEIYNTIINSDSKGKTLRECVIKHPEKYKYIKI